MIPGAGEYTSQGIANSLDTLPGFTSDLDGVIHNTVFKMRDARRLANELAEETRQTALVYLKDIGVQYVADGIARS